MAAGHTHTHSFVSSHGQHYSILLLIIKLGDAILQYAIFDVELGLLHRPVISMCVQMGYAEPESVLQQLFSVSASPVQGMELHIYIALYIAPMCYQAVLTHQ